MQMEAMELGLLRTNCYLIWDGGSAIAIDPGYDAARIIARLQELRQTLVGIVLTHGHFDHVGAVQGLKDAYACPVYLSEPDTHLPKEMTNGQIPYTNTFQEGDTLSFGAIRLKVLLTPGHTPGSACFRLGPWLFTGDTLFRDACGRTDFPGGSWREMKKSLQRLSALQEDYFVYPGHGDATTLEREKKYNPYLQEALS